MVLPQNAVNYSNKNNGGRRKKRVEQGVLKGRKKKHKKNRENRLIKSKICKFPIKRQNQSPENRKKTL